MQTINITIRQTEYQVRQRGKGKIPIVCVGAASLVERTLSSLFYEMFEFYGTDLYWTETTRMDQIEQMHITDIADDILKVVDQLHLNKPILLGHSAFGMLQLEAAKRDQSRISGVVMIGTPIESNQTGLKRGEQYFQDHADQARKENDQQRKAKLQAIPHPRFVETYIASTARYWGAFDLSDQLFHHLWQGLNPDPAAFGHLFGNLLPALDLFHQIGTITVPVLLAAGEYDFDCTPLVSWQNVPVPQNFTILNCGKVGHWPHYENAPVFDDGLINWTLRSH